MRFLIAASMLLVSVPVQGEDCGALLLDMIHKGDAIQALSPQSVKEAFYQAEEKYSLACVTERQWTTVVVPPQPKVAEKK